MYDRDSYSPDDYAPTEQHAERCGCRRCDPDTAREMAEELRAERDEL